MVATSGPDALWRPGNPDNVNEEEGCMEIFDGEWNDAPCDYHNSFICEKVLNWSVVYVQQQILPISKRVDFSDTF